MKGSQNKSRIISIIITMLVIFMLIISEPAGAVTVKMDTSNMDKTVGQEGYFYFNVTIGGNEKIPVANFTIEGLPHIDGSSDGTLVFDASDVGAVGSVFSKGNYDIKLVEKHGWKFSDNTTFGNFTNRHNPPFVGYGGYGYSFVGYGFGYGYGLSNPDVSEYTKLAYQIFVDTTGATADTYDVTGKINTGFSSRSYFSSDSSTSTSSFTLAAKESTSGGSSSGGSSRFSWTTPTSTPVPTKTEDTTQGQATPIKTEKKDEVSTGDQETQTPTIPTETEDGGLPGFTAIMFIAGLLGAAYIIIRKRG